jgi:hypothetical protein
MNPGPNTPPYRLLSSGAVEEELRHLGFRAVELGVGPRFGAALLVIRDALQTAPREWGDPVRVYHHLRQTYYKRIHDELLVEYTVHEAEPFVWLVAIHPILGHPMNPETNG